MHLEKNKIIKYATFLIVGLMVGAIIVGVLNGVVGKGEWNLGWTDYRYDDSAYTVGEGTVRAPYLENIDLDWIDGNVTVVICQDAYVSISETAPADLTEKTQVHWSVSEDGKSLSIKYRGSSSFFGTNKDKEKDLILRIPQKLIGQLKMLNIKAVSSNVTVSDVVIDNVNVTTKSGDVVLKLPTSTAFTLTHQTKRGGTPTIDFPITKEGNTYVSGANGIKISVKTNSGKVNVTSSQTKPPKEEQQPMPSEPIGIVQVYQTTGSKSALLQQQKSVSVSQFDREDKNRQTVYVDSTAKYQSYVGYGASLTHASAYLLMQADEATRTTVLQELFSRDGANLSLVRIPIGASDYIPGDTYFTCDDMPSGKTDMTLEHFNLDHDSDIIAVAKQILQINPNVTFMASPWSAPAWMKTNGRLVGAAGLKSNMYEVYADYLVKFVTEYQKEGISIQSLTLVNEPNVGNLSYPTMNMSGKEAAIITAHVGSKLEALGLTVDIVAWDYNYGSSYASSADAYLDALYKDYAETAGKYSNTVGFHGYDGDAYWNSSRNFGMKSGIQRVSQVYGKASIITEITESEVSYDFANNLTWACKNIILAPCAVQSDGEGNLWNGCGGALYWNLVLDSNGQPCPANHGACFGVISLDSYTQADGTIAYRYSKSSAYYAMAQVSKFLYDVDGVGCYAINATTTSQELTVLAYYRNDGAIVTVVLNENRNTTLPVDIVIDGRKISYEIPPQSLVTFIDNKNEQELYSTYNFESVTMQQLGDARYQFDLVVDCADDAVAVYLTKQDFIAPTDVAKVVSKEISGSGARFSFVAELEQGMEYYLWVVGAEKQMMLPLCVPRMNPYLKVYSNQSADLYFQFASKTSHVDFCDPNGKSIYVSNSPIFDDSATPFAQRLLESTKGYRMNANQFDASKYYFVVLTAKNGILTYISLPVPMENAQ